LLHAKREMSTTDAISAFVHGLPETSRIWDGLRRVLGRDSIALALPGFGIPRPAGFTATKDAYAEWLADALNGIEQPIDLVGHDVGALISLRVATAFDSASAGPARRGRDVLRGGAAARRPDGASGRSRALLNGRGPRGGSPGLAALLVLTRVALDGERVFV
jgi:pimeloyl-ACP methyl ester carboxylesterase